MKKYYLPLALLFCLIINFAFAPSHADTKNKKTSTAPTAQLIDKDALNKAAALAPSEQDEENMLLKHMRCGMKLDRSKLAVREQAFQARLRQLDPFTPLATGGTINVYFHKIRPATEDAKSYISDYQLTEQMKVLNNAFASAGWTFNLVSVDTQISDSWFYLGKNTPEEKDVKQHLHMGGYMDLNIYSVDGILSGGEYGWTSLPGSTSSPVDDGVVITSKMVTNYSNNTNISLVHLVGHWMGLLDTYQGGCNQTNDYIDDTPAEANTYDDRGSCPEGRDTCTGSAFPGLDPIHNYMNDTAFSCRSEFTPGQIDRMNKQYALYRANVDRGPSLSANQNLFPGQYLTSANGKYRLVLQTDSNLVVYNANNQPLWSTHTYGKGVARCELQTDGNLALYNNYNSMIWYSNSHNGSGTVTLTMQDDGYAGITDGTSNKIWGTWDTLYYDQQLLPGQSIYSPNRQYRLWLRTDGDLILVNSGGGVLWATNTMLQPIRNLIMQSDGNLVLYRTNGTPAWASNTNGKGKSQLQLQNDGNLVISTVPGSTPTWNRYSGRLY